MKKAIGWLVAVVAFAPILPIVVAVGFMKKLQTGEVTMQELVAKYCIDAILVVGVVVVCAIICFALEKRRKSRAPALGGQEVKLTFKDEKEERILRWAEEGEGRKIVELADRMSRETTGIVPAGSQETPWAVFGGTQAFFERVSEQLARRWPWKRRR